MERMLFKSRHESYLRNVVGNPKTVLGYKIDTLFPKLLVFDNV